MTLDAALKGLEESRQALADHQETCPLCQACQSCPTKLQLDNAIRLYEDWLKRTEGQK